MSLRNARASFGLTASGQPTRTGTGGEVTLGNSGARDYGSGGMFSVLIAGITNAINPSINAKTGIVTENGATSTDEGVNFEGKPPAIFGLQAFLIERLDSSTQAVIATGSSGAVLPIPSGGFVIVGVGVAASGSGVPVFTDTSFTFQTVGSDATTVRVTSLGTTLS